MTITYRREENELSKSAHRRGEPGEIFTSINQLPTPNIVYYNNCLLQTKLGPQGFEK